MTDRYEVARVEEFSDENSRVITEVRGREIAVFELDGAYHAVLNYCVHQAGPLCEGARRGHVSLNEDGWGWDYDDDNSVIVCPWHSWGFDITTGQSVDDPRYVVPTYDVAVEDGVIYVTF